MLHSHKHKSTCNAEAVKESQQHRGMLMAWAPAAELVRSNSRIYLKGK